MTTKSGDNRLSSWKSIARYFGKSERTVRRWEAEEGLPVRRHMHRAQGSVFAWEHELATWQAARSEASRPEPLPGASCETVSVIVMPFRYLGSDPANAYLAVGFTDELISDLTRLDDLRVISRTSSYALAERALSTAEIRKLLKVDTLIEGSVLQAGDKVKASVQMIDCRKDQSTWSHTVSCDFDGIFDAQAKLVEMIAETMSPAGAEPPRDPPSMRRSRDRNIWEAMVRARIEALRWTPAAIRNAAGLLEASIERFGEDPGLMSALGRCHLFLREIGADMTSRPLKAAGRCLDALRESAPDASATHHLEGWIAYQRGDMSAAMRSLRSAHEADADDCDTLALLSYCYLLSGLDDLAGPLVEKLMSLDPLTPLNHSIAACKDLFAGRFEDATASYAYMCALDPSNKMAHLFHVMALSLARNEAAVLQKVEAVAGPADAAPIDRMLHAFASAVRREAIAPMPGIDALMKRSTVDMFPRLMAEAHGLSGNRGAALEWLSLAVERGFKNHHFIAHIDPSFAGLREDDAFLRLTRKIEQDTEDLRRQFG